MVVIWNTERVAKGGNVTVLVKAHTDVDIVSMRIASFDETRLSEFSAYPSTFSALDILLYPKYGYLLGPGHTHAHIYVLYPMGCSTMIGPAR